MQFWEIEHQFINCIKLFPMSYSNTSLVAVGALLISQIIWQWKQLMNFLTLNSFFPKDHGFILSKKTYSDTALFKKYRVNVNPYLLGRDTEGFDNKVLKIFHLYQAIWLMCFGFIGTVLILILELWGFKRQKKARKWIRKKV